MTILHINDWDKISVNIQKKTHLWNRIYIYVINSNAYGINQNTSKRKEEEF